MSYFLDLVFNGLDYTKMKRILFLSYQSISCQFYIMLYQRSIVNVHVQELFAIIFLTCLCCTLVKSGLMLTSSIPQPSEIDCDSI